MIRRCMLGILMAVVCIGVYGQATNPFSLSLTPGVSIPLGPLNSDGKKPYTIGGSAALSGEYAFPSAPFVYAEGLLDYAIIPTTAQAALSLISIGAGTGIKINVVPKLMLKISAAGGYTVGIYEGNLGGAPFVAGEAQLLYALSPTFSLGLGTVYEYHFNLYNGVGVVLGTTFNLGGRKGRSKVNIIDIQLDPIFPVFYSYYDDNPLGSSGIRNAENGTIKDIKVSLFVERYMDKPKLCAHIPEMKKNEEKQVPLYALFTDRILEITEGTKVAATIIIEYNYLDTVITGETNQTVQIFHRNAMTWDDDRKAASFVTAKDPEILRFSKNIAGELRTTGIKAVNSNFRNALGLFEALREYGINYVIDPTTPYAEFSQSKFSLDYLQFPIQTMSYKAGDCDDLSILYSALLESVGIKTAFITVPGHIYMAFRLGIDPDDVGKVFSRPEDLIIYGNETWVPVEITMIQDGFLKAWQTGAKEWRENEPEGAAAFYPIHEAWGIFAPVGIADNKARIEGFPQNQLLPSYVRELERFVKREISEKVENLRDRIAESGNNPKLINKLGVLYARYGLYDKAVIEFEKAVRAKHIPSLVNLANIAFLQSDYAAALNYFNQAQNADPNNISVLVGLAKTNYELENYGSVKMIYDKIVELDPDTSVRFSYLISKREEQDRASAAVREEGLIWDEEE